MLHLLKSPFLELIIYYSKVVIMGVFCVREMLVSSNQCSRPHRKHLLTLLFLYKERVLNLVIIINKFQFANLSVEM